MQLASLLILNFPVKIFFSHARTIFCLPVYNQYIKQSIIQSDCSMTQRSVSGESPTRNPLTSILTAAERPPFYWVLCGSSPQCRWFVCSLISCYFLIILIIFCPPPFRRKAEGHSFRHSVLPSFRPSFRPSVPLI